MDLEKQRAETFWVFEEIRLKHGVPDKAAVDFQFIPQGSAPDWDGFARFAEAEGYTWRRYDDGGTFEVTTLPMTLTAQAIWRHERKLTLQAVKFGFAADGWGFESPTPGVPKS